MNPVQISPNELEYINHFLEEANNNSDPLVITIKGTVTIVQGSIQSSGSSLVEAIEQLLGY